MNTKKGLVIWLTGLPCSGKTTISLELEKYFQEKHIRAQRLDGDIVRDTISKDLGFSKEDRDKNIERMAYITQMLADNGVHVITAFVSPYASMREFARSLNENFIEVFVDCDVDKCKKRDVKGMYKQAEEGKITDFTGVQDPFEGPKNPEIRVNTHKESLEESVREITQFIENSLHDQA